MTAAEWRAPASYAQERIWLADRLAGGTPVYHDVSAIPIPSPPDGDAVVNALATVVARHETLRTALRYEHGELVQVVMPELPVAVIRHDLTAVPAEQHASRLRAFYAAAVAEPIDLACAPLWRARLVALGGDGWELILAAHHCICDGTSWANLGLEIRELCAASAECRPPQLPALAVQYADYAAWQRERLGDDAIAAGLTWWRERLAGLPAVHAVPTDRPRPATPRHHGGDVHIDLPPGFTTTVEAAAQRWAATPFMVLLAIYAAVIARLSGQDDIAIGVPVAGRDLPELAPLIGMFVNTIVLRLDLSGDPAFAELVGRVRASALDAFEHQDTPFHKLVEALAAPRGDSAPPLVQLGFNHLPLAESNAGHGTAKEDLTLEVARRDARLEYDADLFDDATARRLAERWLRVGRAALADPQLRLSQLPLLDDAERAFLVQDCNLTPTPSVTARTVLELVRARRDENPGAPAVVDGTMHVSYADLLTRADRLAARLRQAGAGPDRLVAVALPRSADLIVALLGVLAAGAAYMPLDPSYPPPRLTAMLSDSRPVALVTTAAGFPSAGVPLVPVDAEPAGPPQTATPPAPEDLAYVIYTSGSTGEPKGVMIEHRSLVSYVTWFIDQYAVGPADRVLASSSPSFDAFGIEVFPALAAGGCVVVAAAADGALDPGEMLRTAERERVTLLAVVPTVLRLLADHPGLRALTRLRGVVCGGEQLTGELVRRLWELRPVPVHNVYGPTETTIDVAYHSVIPGEAVCGPVPIGRPVARTRLHVLDHHGSVVPAGTVGELYIGGPHLARGYLRRPAATAAAFVPDPLGPPGQRLYRTGDLVRRLPSGEIVFVGRADKQRKLRGRRIELGEVETALRSQPGVGDAVALIRQATGSGARDEQLVGYVTPAGTAAIDPGAVRAALRDRLPAFLVPAAIVALPALPLTPNGKLDETALPELGPAVASPSYAAPEGAAEELVAAVFAELLGAAVGRDDDFFALGGHSLLAARAAARLAAKTGVDIPIRTIFTAPTVARLAEKVEELLLAELDQLTDDQVAALLADGEA